MLVAESKRAFRSFLEARGLHLDQLEPVAAITAWIDFYKIQRFDDCEDDMDWLWFQAGPGVEHDRYFELDLTRQFGLEGKTDDDAIVQLRLVLSFPRDACTRSGGFIDCEDPADADRFKDTVLSSRSARAVEALAPERVRMYLDPC